MFSLTESAIDEAPLSQAVATPAAGAVVLFRGTVRNKTRGKRVRYLEYEAYPAMALAQMNTIAGEIARERGPLMIACTHRTGRLEIGDVAVVVVVAAPHRRAALDAVDDFVTRLKREVPIWKKEHFEDGAVWVGSEADPQGERAEISR